MITNPRQTWEALRILEKKRIGSFLSVTVWRGKSRIAASEGKGEMFLSVIAWKSEPLLHGHKQNYQSSIDSADGPGTLKAAAVPS